MMLMVLVNILTMILSVVYRSTIGYISVNCQSRLGRLSVDIWVAILPHLTYCHLVWHFCRASDTHTLERVQERGLRAVFKDKQSSYRQLLLKTKLPTLYNRRLQDIYILMYKVKHNLCLRTICDMFLTNSHTYNLWQKDFYQSSFNTVTHGKHSIRYLGPRLWSKISSKDRYQSYPV